MRAAVDAAPVPGALEGIAGPVEVGIRRIGRASKPAVFDEPGRAWEFWFQVVAKRPWYDPDREHVIAFGLDGAANLRAWWIVAIGGRGGAFYDPPGVLRPAVVAGVSRVLLAHNHPSGTLKPSRADLESTAQLVAAGRIVGVPLVDHVIVTAGGSLSIRGFLRAAGSSPWGDSKLASFSR